MPVLGKNAGVGEEIRANCARTGEKGGAREQIRANCACTWAKSRSKGTNKK